RRPRAPRRPARPLRGPGLRQGRPRRRAPHHPAAPPGPPAGDRRGGGGGGVTRFGGRAAQLATQATQALPQGTGAVGAGLAVSAVTSYVFVVVSLNALSGEAAAAFSAFWAVIFVAGPGFFLPLEQEVGRAIAHRRAQGLGGGPLVHRAARLGAIITF